MLSRVGLQLLIHMGVCLKSRLLIRVSRANNPAILRIQTHEYSWFIHEHEIDLLESTTGGFNTELSKKSIVLDGDWKIYLLRNKSVEQS